MEDTGQGPAENVPESPPAADVEVEDEEDGGGFSFPAPPLAADACIVPVYPIFGRPPSPSQAEGHEPETATVRVPLGRLLLEEREFRARQRRDGRSESARAWRDHQNDGDGDEEEEEDGEASAVAAGEELEGVPPESYCLWAPGGGGQASAPASPRQCRKSGSTGSVLRWRRISDRLVGRSHSDGKEKFVFLTAAAAAEGARTCRTSKSLSGCSPTSAGCAGAITRSSCPYDAACFASSLCILVLHQK
ncbi:unnamed protein product [Urochloa humidicola]